MCKKFILVSLLIFIQLTAKAGLPMDTVIVFNAGKNGNNTTNLLKRVDKDVLQRSPDIVVMMVGTNDMFNPRNHLNVKEYEKNYQKLITVIKKHAKLVLMTIPPVYAPYIIKRKPMFHFGPDGLALKVDSANAVIRQLALKNNCTLIDLNRILTACGGPDTAKNGLFQNRANFGIADGVHPTYNGARVIAAAVYRTIRMMKPEAKRIICFGDSITRGYRLKGEGTTEGHTYPAILKRMFNLR